MIYLRYVAYNVKNKLNLQPLRPMMSFVKNYNNIDIIGVEIGTFLGYHAMNILKRLPIKKLYLIDPYVTYRTRYRTTRKYDNEHWNKTYEKAKSNLNRFSDKVVFVRKNSSDAVDIIPDGLNFVYIDGNHEYDYVKKDINMYYPKVKIGGIIGGHDVGFFGVAKAVVEFSDLNNLKVYMDYPDWWIIKSKNG